VVPLGGKEYRIVLSRGNNHFAKKHLIFPGGDDAEKLLQGVRQNRDYLEAKAVSRLIKRDVLADDRHLEKFHTKKAVVVNCALNMKPLNVAQNAPARHIDQKLAAVKIAEALAVRNLVAGEEFEMDVDFACPCVVTAFYKGKAKAETGAKWGPTMHVKGRVADKLEADKPEVELFHAGT
jgi:hypothetical protein